MGLSIRSLCTAVAVSIFVFAVQPAKADIQKMQFEVVGTWGFLENWQQFEEPFWTDTLPAASGGKLTANAKP